MDGGGTRGRRTRDAGDSTRFQSPNIGDWQIRRLIFRSRAITAMPAILSLRYFNAFPVPPR
jgi:hypothetical protein